MDSFLKQIRAISKIINNLNKLCFIFLCKYSFKRDSASNECKLALRRSRSSLKPASVKFAGIHTKHYNSILWKYIAEIKLPKSKLQIWGSKRRTLLIGHFPQLLTELLFTVELLLLLLLLLKNKAKEATWGGVGGKACTIFLKWAKQSKFYNFPEY